MSAGFTGINSEIEHTFIRPAINSGGVSDSVSGPAASPSSSSSGGVSLLSEMRCYRNVPYTTQSDAMCRKRGVKVYQTFCIAHYHPMFC